VKPDELYQAIVEQQGVADEIKRAHSEANEKLEGLKSQMLALLNEQGVSSLRFAGGGSVGKSVRWSVKLPATPSDRDRFFAFIQGTGDYDELRTVNYASLNSWFKSVMEQAKERGDFDFRVPGLDEPVAQEILSVRKS
jgi:hypothetical protein